jgi:hypothetical protein
MSVTRILLNAYNFATRWSDRENTTGYFKILKQRVRRFLISLSGDDVSSMLSDVLTKEEISNVASKYVNALRYISEAVNNNSIIKPKKRHHIIRPLRLAGITKREVNELGFRCGKKLWKSCLNRNERNLAGRPRLPLILVNEIKEHMQSLSNIASNRSVIIRTFADRNPTLYYKKKTIRKQYVSARYRETTLNDAFKQFKEKAQDINDDLRERRLSIPLSTFKYKIDSRYKTPFRLTDLCHFCEIGKRLAREIKVYMQFRDYDQEFDADKMLDFLVNNPNETDELAPLYKKKIKLFKSVIYHKSIAIRQRNSYNNERLSPDLLNGKIVIEIDYKAKMLLGLGPRQLNSEFYEADKKKVYVLGFGIYHVDKSRNYPFVNLLNIDVISDYDGQKATDVIKIFKHIMTTPEFIQVDQASYVVWVDCGKQFRSKEFLYFCANSLARQGKSVSLNFFCEKHGKNNRDQHFSVVSRAFENAVQKNQSGLNSAEEVVEALNFSYIYHNDEKLEKNQTFNTSLAIHFNPTNERGIIGGTRAITGEVELYYHLKTVMEIATDEDFEDTANEIVGNHIFRLYTSIFSDQTFLIPLDTSVSRRPTNFTLSTKTKDRIRENHITPLSHEEVKSTIKKLTNKRKNIDIKLREGLRNQPQSAFQVSLNQISLEQRAQTRLTPQVYLNMGPQIPAQPNMRPQIPAQPNMQTQIPAQPNMLPQIPTQPNMLPQIPTQPNMLPQIPAQPNMQTQNPAQPNMQPQNPVQANMQSQNTTQQGSQPNVTKP